MHGCASIDYDCSPSTSDANNTSSVTLYRVHARYGMLYSPTITVDNCYVSDLANNDFIKLNMKSGKHTIRAEKGFLAAGGDAEISHVFQRGEEYYIRYILEAGEARYMPTPSTGFVRWHAGSAWFSLTSREEAHSEFPAIRQDQ